MVDISYDNNYFTLRLCLINYYCKNVTNKYTKKKNNFSEYQKVQIKEKKLHKERERDEEKEYCKQLIENSNRELENQKMKDLQKILQLQKERREIFKEVQCKTKEDLQPMGFLLNDPHRKEKCGTCDRRRNWNKYV